MRITGKIRDIQPNEAEPRLELSFQSGDRNMLPQGERAGIVLEIKGIRWHGTINTVNNNPPYVHAKLTDESGSKTRCTEVFLYLGLAEKSKLEFEAISGNALRLAEVIDAGQW